MRKLAILLIAITCLYAAAEPGLRTLGRPDGRRFELTDITWPAETGTAEICLWKDDKYTATLATVSSEPSRIVLSLTDKMDDALFDEPLTLKVRLPDGWKSVSATQGGSPIPSSIVEHEGHPYALVNAVPDRGEICVGK